VPTYEYECAHCGHTFEAFQNMNDRPLDKCPKCHKKPKRLISSGAGIIFKGSGFYATDYKKKSRSGASGAGPKNTCPKLREGCYGCKGVN
jgi:putative FmdB family regulatory protein